MIIGSIYRLLKLVEYFLYILIGISATIWALDIFIKMQNEIYFPDSTTFLSYFASITPIIIPMVVLAFVREILKLFKS